jgi:hypothetical protein
MRYPDTYDAHFHHPENASFWLQIFFGKPWAQFYVDDLAVDPLCTSQTVAKQTGFHSSAIKVRVPPLDPL